MDKLIKKELILINPSVSNRLAKFTFKLAFKKQLPYSLLILSALTPKDYKVRIFHQKILWFKNDFPAGALVGITCVTQSAPQAYKIAMRYRKAGAYVVMGGPHVSSLAEEALRYCDSVVIGEAESEWAQVIKDFENKSLKKIYTGKPIQDCFSSTYDYFLNSNPRIFFRSGIMVSRGCKYHCDFCARPFGGPRFAKIEQIVAIIKRMKECVRNPFIKKPTIIFHDDNIFSDPAYAKKLFKELIPLNIRWLGNSCVDIAFDEEALFLAKKSGCRLLFIGFETIYPEKLAKTSVHGMTSTRDYTRAIKKIKSYRIRIIGSFILGFDYYTHLDYLRLLGFLIKSRFYFSSLTILTPFPGTELYERLKKEDRIITFDWGKYNLLFDVVFKPKNLSALSLKLWFIATRIISLCFYALTLQLVLVAFCSVMFGQYAVYILSNVYYYIQQRLFF